MVRKKKLPKASGDSTILPVKHEGIEELVRKYFESGTYFVTGHAKERLSKREVTILDIRKILIKKQPKY